MVNPFATGYSPFRMCTSVPQIVVVVIRRSASKGPGEGTAFSSITIRPGSTNMAAFIILGMTDIPSIGYSGRTALVAYQHRNLGFLEHVARYAAKHRFPKSRMPIAPHNQQGRRPLFVRRRLHQGLSSRP